MRLMIAMTFPLLTSRSAWCLHTHYIYHMGALYGTDNEAGVTNCCHEIVIADKQLCMVIPYTC